MHVQVIETLARHLSHWAFHPAFPELAHLPLLRLRKLAKSLPVERFRTALRALVVALESQADLVTQHRARLPCAPSNTDAVAGFMADEALREQVGVCMAHLVGLLPGKTCTHAGGRAVWWGWRVESTTQTRRTTAHATVQAYVACMHACMVQRLLSGMLHACTSHIRLQHAWQTLICAATVCLQAPLARFTAQLAQRAAQKQAMLQQQDEGAHGDGSTAPGGRSLRRRRLQPHGGDESASAQEDPVLQERSKGRRKAAQGPDLARAQLAQPDSLPLPVFEVSGHAVLASPDLHCLVYGSAQQLPACRGCIQKA